MNPLIDEPLFPLPDQPLPAAAEHLARTAYLSAVQDAQQRCGQRITAARTDYVQAEHDAWTAYQAASSDAVRAWLSPPGDGGNRWFTPASDSHPYTETEH